MLSLIPRNLDKELGNEEPQQAIQRPPGYDPKLAAQIADRVSWRNEIIALRFSRVFSFGREGIGDSNVLGFMIPVVFWKMGVCNNWQLYATPFYLPSRLYI